MSFNIHDPYILDKIASVEGQEWKEEQEISASLAEDEKFEMFTVMWAVTQWGLRPTSRPVIYGLCGTHRYMVQEDGEVMFSAHHGRGHVEKASAAGFRIFR
jgi:hypothetical protein